MKILFAASEAHPLIKTGGLADVAGSLPLALKAQRQDVRLVLPAYPEVLENIGSAQHLGDLDLHGQNEPVRLLEGQMPGSKVPCYLIDAPRYFDRPGNPYNDSAGHAWPDNAQRFYLFCQAIHALATDRAGLDWRPDVVHCNDWQTGLVPALLSDEPKRPACLFTVHNLAYAGNFDWGTFQALGLPYQYWSSNGVEFFGNLSFMKGGLAYADHINTVSSTYAREICTPAFGHGFEGLLRFRSKQLSGIINGVDYNYWDPRKDPHIETPFGPKTLEDKAANKAALQAEMGLPVEADIPLVAHIGRLVDQKGVDLILEALPALLEQEMQMVILGSGQRTFEDQLRQAAKEHGDRFAIRVGYNEPLAHRIEASADMFLMPSRFEPCGLNQIYSLRYGTVPIVHRVGGLADTVIDAIEHNLAQGIATGFVFDELSGWGVQDAVERALALYAEPERWQKLQRTGMKQDFSWKRSAAQYLDLYQRMLTAA